MERTDEAQETKSKPGRGHRPFLLGVLALSLYLAYLILYPFLNTLVFAIVLASLFYPLQVRLVRLYKGRNNLAAFTVVFLITFVVALPAYFFISALVSQGSEIIGRINHWLNAGNLQKLSEHMLSSMAWIRQHFTFLEHQQFNLKSHFLGLSKGFGQFLLSEGKTILGGAANLVFNFFVMIFVVFYLVRDGKQMVKTVKYFSPLREEQEDRILNAIRLVAHSVLFGSFLNALVQGLVGGIGLALVGIPGLFWGTVMGFASFIPVIGTSLVWIPAALYLFFNNRWEAAIFIILWSSLLVGSIDNFMRPFFMRGTRMSPFYIFLAIIGGVQYFGLVGILYGPLILGFAMVMLYIYGVEYQDLLGGPKPQPPIPLSPDPDDS